MVLGDQKFCIDSRTVEIFTQSFLLLEKSSKNWPKMVKMQTSAFLAHFKRYLWLYARISKNFNKFGIYIKFLIS